MRRWIGQPPDPGRRADHDPRLALPFLDVEHPIRNVGCVPRHRNSLKPLMLPNMLGEVG